jgi:hypothetical protein
MEEYSIPYLAFCVAVGYYAKTKGRSPWCWGLASLFFSPFLVGIILALCKDLTDRHRIDALSMEQRQIKDRMSMNEVNTNRRFQSLEHNQVQGQITGRQAAYLPPVYQQPVGPASGSEGRSFQEGQLIGQEQAYNDVVILPEGNAAASSSRSGEVLVSDGAGPKMKFCSNCGQKLPAEARFCSNCGAEQKSEPEL